MPMPTVARRATLLELIEAGLLVPGTVLHRGRPRPGVNHYATVLANGNLRFDNGRQFSSPTAAAQVSDGKAVWDGWTTWILPDGRSLAELSDEFTLLDGADHSDAGASDSRDTPEAVRAHDLGLAVLQPSLANTPLEAAAWLSAGESFAIDGRRISGGFVYVGGPVSAVGEEAREPSLIDPTLPVDWENPDWSGDTLYYLPDYREFDPRARAAYLCWLAHGRRHAGVDISYVLLFYFGLERRLLIEMAEDFDHPGTDAIVAEIEALLGVYGGSRQFGVFALSLLDLVEAVRSVRSPLRPVEPPRLTRVRSGAEVPPLLRVGLGRCVSDGCPVTAQWALSYLRHHPSRPHRIPEDRCRVEFDELFAARYSQRYGDGIMLEPTRRELVLGYRPASPGIRHELRRPIRSVPDVEQAARREDLTSLLHLVTDLAWECADDLEAYRRFLERWPDRAASAVGSALLPEELVDSHAGGSLADLRKWISETLGGGSSVSVRWDEVVRRCTAASERLPRSDAVLVSQLLARLGVGMEPDVRFGGTVARSESEVVLFALGDGAPSVPSPGYAAACAVVHLAATVAAADGSISLEEQQFLARHIESGLRLDAVERARLEAHIAYLAKGSFDASETMRRIGALSADQRSGVGELLVDVAAADGKITPDEVHTLMTLFERLGLAQTVLFELLGKASVDTNLDPVAVLELRPASEMGVLSPPATAEVAASPTGSGSSREPHPPAAQPVDTDPPESGTGRHAEGANLDTEAIDRKLAEDSRTTALLADIFAEAPDSDEDLDDEFDLDLDEDFDLDDDFDESLDEGNGDTSAEHQEAIVPDERPASHDPQKLGASGAGRSRSRSRLAGPLGRDSEDPDSDLPILAVPDSPVRTSGLLIWGLDVEHARLAVALTREQRWSRADAEDLAGPLGLGMLNGAIDMINEAAVENCDEPLLEGEDILKLNYYAAERLVEAAAVGTDAALSVFHDDWSESARLTMGIESGDPVL